MSSKIMGTYLGVCLKRDLVIVPFDMFGSNLLNAATYFEYLLFSDALYS